MYDDSDYNLHRHFGRDYSRAVGRKQAMQRQKETMSMGTQPIERRKNPTTRCKLSPEPEAPVEIHLKPNAPGITNARVEEISISFPDLRDIL